MPKIVPFKGILYNQNGMKMFAKAVTPPYDAISSEQQKMYYRQSQYNIIRLILGKTNIGDNENNNKYTRAAGFLNDWLKKGVLKRDRKPSIYLYSQQYRYGAENKMRWGFIALMKINNSDRSSILPHEEIMLGPKQDRLNLLEGVKANLSPIFSLFSDPGGKITALIKKYCKQSRPYINFEQEQVVHKLWRISDKMTINKITENMKNKQVFIADGHHRYQAAMEFYNQMRGRGVGRSDKYNYVMVYFTASSKAGLTILPTHRLLTSKIGKDELKKRLDKYFKLTKFNNYLDVVLSMEKAERKNHLFGMYEGESFYLLRLRSKKISDNVIGRKKPLQWKKLDVAILHSLILGKILSLKNGAEKIGYTQDASFAIREVDNGRYRMVFFLNPTKISQVTAIAEKGMKMPQKSTYFYPKVVSGLVINKFDNET